MCGTDNEDALYTFINRAPKHRSANPPATENSATSAMKATAFNIGLLVLLRSAASYAQFDSLWEMCPKVEHANCDAALQIKADACGSIDTPQNSTCNCRQDFIDRYVK